MNINNNLPESDTENIDVKSQLEHQIQIEEAKESGWIFDKNNSMKTRFYKIVELNGTNYVKSPSRSNVLINIKNNDEYCFIWSILASLRPCNDDHLKKVSIYKQHFDELNTEIFDFTNGFKCSDVHKFEKPNKLSINIIVLNFYQDQKKWKHKLKPIEVSENESDGDIDSAIYKEHYFLIKKLNVFLGYHHKHFISRRCLNSYTMKICEWYINQNVKTMI